MANQYRSAGFVFFLFSFIICSTCFGSLKKFLLFVGSLRKKFEQICLRDPLSVNFLNISLFKSKNTFRVVKSFHTSSGHHYKKILKVEVESRLDINPDKFNEEGKPAFGFMMVQFDLGSIKSNLEATRHNHFPISATLHEADLDGHVSTI